MKRSRVRLLAAVAGVALIVAIADVAVRSLPSAQAQSATLQPQSGPIGPVPPADTANLWRSVRKGITGHVSIADPKAATLVQSEGQEFREFRNGPLSSWGGWLFLVVLVALAAFFAWRGQIRIEGGATGRSVERFNVLDRFTHWLTAGSFVLLALTGLNMLYGRGVILPVIGLTLFSWLTALGKYLHNYIAFAFMVGLVMMFVLWVRHNLPRASDLAWLAKGGGLLSKKGVHPPAYKFNAGQKIVFWIVVLGGFSLSFSGVCLLLPFELHPFAPTFRFLDAFGFHLPTTLTALQETQLALVWHGMVALVMIAVILAHIYIGSVGMEGALESMVSGRVDENWAREHHSLWAAQVAGGAGKPAAGGG